MDSNASWTPAGSGDRSPEEERSLRTLFDGLRPREEELPRLEEVRRTLEARLSGPVVERVEPGRKGWLEMWNPAHWGALRLAGAVSLLLLVLACTVPLNYEREAGLTLDLKVGGDLEPVLKLLREGPWSVENLNVEEEALGSRVRARLRDASREELAVFEGLPGVEIDSRPWEEDARGSLFSMVMDNMFNVQLNINGMSDEQINQALQQQLDAQGYPGRVTVTRDEEGGLPQVHVEVESDSASPGPLTIALSQSCDSTATAGEWTLQGGGRGLPDLPLEDLRGLSEAEIRAKVMEKLRLQGVNPDSVKVLVRRQVDDSTPGQAQEGLRIEVRK